MPTALIRRVDGPDAVHFLKGIMHALRRLYGRLLKGAEVLLVQLLQSTAGRFKCDETHTYTVVVVV